MNQEEIYNLMVKKLAGEISAGEDEQLKAWLEQDQKNILAFDELKKIWTHAERDVQEINVDAAWEKVDRKTRTRVISLRNAVLWKVAAVFVAFAVLGYWALNTFNVQMITVATAANQVKKVELPDGSTVWLHEHSSLSYEDKLAGSKRNLVLKGLAFFSVKRDEAHPFIIKTPKGSVEVLGTSFEVHAFENDTFERVTVNTGKVRFEGKNNQEMILTADQEGMISVRGTSESHHVDAGEITSWREGRLVFNDETMDSVGVKIARYFHVDVRFAEKGILNCRFTGTFDKQTLNNVLDAISLATKLTYRIQGNRVIFDGKGCPAKK